MHSFQGIIKLTVHSATSPCDRVYKKEGLKALHLFLLQEILEFPQVMFCIEDIVVYTL